MSQPPAYTRQFDFSDFQSTAPATPLPGNQVDAEFNAVKTTLDALLQNIAIIQRDDGKLRNQSVHPEALSNAALTLLNTSIVIRGAWVTATAYVQNDVVTQGSNAYLCLVAHTSGTFATDLAAAKWALLTQQGIAPDGSIPAAANIPMAGFKFTNLGAGSARSDSVNLGQVQDMSVQWAAVSGTANAIVLTLTPAISAYTAGMTWKFKATGNNSGATTVNAGGGVIAVQKNGAALVGGEIKTGRTYELTYDGAVAQIADCLEYPVSIAQGGTGAATAAAAFSALKQDATDAATGVVELATSAEVRAGAVGKVATTDQIPQAPYVGRRNRVINGNFDSWQLGPGGAASFSSPASGSYLADTWLLAIDGTAGTYTISEYELSQTERNAVQALIGSAPRRALRWNHSVAGSGQTLKQLLTRVENLRQFQNCKVRISWVAWCGSGTHSMQPFVYQVYGTGGSPSSADVVGGSAQIVTTTPQRFAATFTIGDFSGKTFGTTAFTDQLSVVFGLPLNATHDTYVTGVQLEIGEATTPFDMLPYAQTVLDCQRYAWTIGGIATNEQVGAGRAATTTVAEITVALPANMRVPPTGITVSNAANFRLRRANTTVACTALAFVSAGPRSALITATVAAGLTVGEMLQLETNNTNCRIFFTGSEL